MIALAEAEIEAADLLAVANDKFRHGQVIVLLRVNRASAVIAKKLNHKLLLEALVYDFSPTGPADIARVNQRVDLPERFGADIKIGADSGSLFLGSSGFSARHGLLCSRLNS